MQGKDFVGSPVHSHTLRFESLVLDIEVEAGLLLSSPYAKFSFAYSKTGKAQGGDGTETATRTASLLIEYGRIFNEYYKIARCIVSHLIYDPDYTPRLIFDRPQGWCGLFPYREEILKQVIEGMAKLPLLILTKKEKG